MPTERRRGSKIDLALAVVMIVQVAVLIYLGLEPFSFSPPNRVEPLSDPPGLRFSAHGIATTPESAGGEELFPDGSLSIHFMIEPDEEPRRGLGTIFSIEDQSSVAPLIIAQWKNWLVVRVRDTVHSRLGYWEIDAAGFQAGRTRLVTITSGPRTGTVIYVDGVASGSARPRVILGDEDPPYGRLLLGCLSNGSAGWRGNLYGLAISRTVLSPDAIAAQHDRVRSKGFGELRKGDDFVAFYDFASLEPQRKGLLHTARNLVAGSGFGDLEIPETFAPLRPAVFGVPRLRDMKADWFLRDLLRNIAGFFPFGFIATLMLARKSDAPGYAIALQAVLLGAILSVGIESVQIAMPMRSSSLSDLSLNVIGSGIGAVFALAFRHTPLGDATVR